MKLQLIVLIAVALSTCLLVFLLQPVGQYEFILNQYDCDKTNPHGRFIFKNQGLTDRDVSRIIRSFISCDNTHLESLAIDFYDNKLTNIQFLQEMFPEGSIYAWIKLKSIILNFGQNQIQSMNGIEKVFLNLRNLEKIDIKMDSNRLTGSGLKSMENAFKNLKYVKELALNFNTNQIEDISGVIKCAQSMESPINVEILYLYMNENRITFIPQEMLKLNMFPHIKKLGIYLSHNFINDIDGLIQTFENGFQVLEHLAIYLYNNKITKFSPVAPSFHNFLRNLKQVFIYLPFNQIQYVDLKFFEYLNVERFHIYLHDNQLRAGRFMADVIRRNNSIKNLIINIANNQLSSIEDFELALIEYSQKHKDLSLYLNIQGNQFDAIEITEIGKLREILIGNLGSSEMRLIS